MHRWILPGTFLIVIMLLISSCKPVLKTEPAAALPSSPTPAAEATSPTANDLIVAAEESGEISSETALEYQIFAEFSNPRLPAKYQGSPDTRPDSHVIAILQSKFNSLSPEAQKVMLPFLMPPVYKGRLADPEPLERDMMSREAHLMCQTAPTPNPIN